VKGGGGESAAGLRRELARRDRKIAKQERQIVELRREVQQLKVALEAALRAGKRQAAPFSKGEPKRTPKRPGRKAGAGYGTQKGRAKPNRVDETILVPCPLQCGTCGGRVELEGKESQFQVDLPPILPHTIEFEIHYGRCRRCLRRVQGRHPRQISNALGVCGVQFGPGVLALAAYLNKCGGLSYGKIADLFDEVFHLQISRSTLARAFQRLSDKAMPTYQGLVEAIRGSPVVYPDETGWRIGGVRSWLWAVTNMAVTVYAILRGRGFEQASSILGEDYDGVIGSDGWSIYAKFEQATRQTCLAHLIRRCREMIETAPKPVAEYVEKIKQVLQDSIALRDRDRNEGLNPRRFLAERRGIHARMDHLLDEPELSDDSLRLAQHLSNNREALFLFLERRDVEATNWPAEQAIRPAVINRKTSGGNRSDTGATAQAILTSIIQTCHQQGSSSLEAFKSMLQYPVPTRYPISPGLR
jgi:transposase